MELSEFTLRAVFLFLPGLLASFVVDKLTYHGERKIHSIALSSLLLGGVCYVALWVVMFALAAVAACLVGIASHQWPGIEYPTLRFLDALQDSATKIQFGEVTHAAVMSIPVGLIVSLVINRKWLHYFAARLRLSNKHGEADVWGFLMNSTELRDSPWVCVRDKRHGVMYQGWIDAFSDDPGQHELLLRDVKAYDEHSGQFRYQVPAVYWPSRGEDVVVDFYFEAACTSSDLSCTGEEEPGAGPEDSAPDMKGEADARREAGRKTSH